jgi:hypothetical protein
MSRRYEMDFLEGNILNIWDVRESAGKGTAKRRYLGIRRSGEGRKDFKTNFFNKLV